MNKYFNNINTLEELKNEYKKLVFNLSHKHNSEKMEKHCNG